LCEPCGFLLALGMMNSWVNTGSGALFGSVKVKRQVKLAAA
jgi:hypothetical protein